MKTDFCRHRRILQPCGLEGHDYQVDPYVGCEHNCHYCYALNAAESDWTKQILIHEAVDRTLSKELEEIPPQSIYIGMNSDPYQPVERTHRQTRRVLEILVEGGFSVCVLTKSPLMTRDVDVYREMDDPYLGFSLAFQNEDDRRRFEPGAPPNAERLRALAALRASGFRTYVLVCPVMPFVTDVTTVVEMAAPVVEHIYVYRLRMERRTDRNWRRVARIVRRYYAEQLGIYRHAAFSAEHWYWRELRTRLEEFDPPHGVKLTLKI